MLLMKIESFLRRTGMPPTRFGREAVRDPRLVHDMRRGRTPGERMTTRVSALRSPGTWMRATPGMRCLLISPNARAQ